jgi:hypothetical protein
MIQSMTGYGKAVKLFPNPTNNTTAEGVPPYTLMVVVYGGTTTNISEKLYSTLGCPTKTYGTTAYTKTTEDNGTEIIYHTKAVERKIAIRVSYLTTNGSVLSDTEKQNITDKLLEVSSTFNINTPVYNIQLVSAVSQVVSLTKFTALLVEVKNEDDLDEVFSSANINPDITEICVLPEANVSFKVIDYTVS